MDPRAAERQASLCDATSGSEAVARVERVYIITCHRRRRRCVLLIAVRRRASTAAAVIFNNGRNFYRPLSDHNLLPELFDDETMKRRAKSVPRASSSNSSVLCRAIRRERRGVVGGGGRAPLMEPCYPPESPLYIVMVAAGGGCGVSFPTIAKGDLGKGSS